MVQFLLSSSPIWCSAEYCYRNHSRNWFSRYWSHFPSLCIFIGLWIRKKVRKLFKMREMEKRIKKLLIRGTANLDSSWGPLSYLSLFVNSMFQTGQTNSLSCIFNLLSGIKNPGEEFLGLNFILATSCLRSWNTPTALCRLTRLWAKPRDWRWVTEKSFVISSRQSSEKQFLCARVWDVSPSEHHQLLTDPHEHLQNLPCAESMSVAIAACHRKNCLPDCYLPLFRFL